MTRRLALKILRHALAYPPHMRARAARRWFSRLRLIAPAEVAHAFTLYRPSRAARRAERVLARRFADDASRWLPGNGPVPTLYGLETAR